MSKESKRQTVSTRQMNVKKPWMLFKKWMLALEEKKILSLRYSLAFCNVLDLIPSTKNISNERFK